MSIEPIYKAVGKRVRRVRKLRGVTQEALANAVGLCRLSVTQLEAGRQRIMLHHIVEIARALRVSADRLLTGKRSPNS